jgi:hypothetical protein
MRDSSTVLVLRSSKRDALIDDERLELLVSSINSIIQELDLERKGLMARVKIADVRLRANAQIASQMVREKDSLVALRRVLCTAERRLELLKERKRYFEELSIKVRHDLSMESPALIAATGTS